MKTQNVTVAEGKVIVEQRERSFVVYTRGQIAPYSEGTCVILAPMESATFTREVEETDIPEIGKGTWTRTERARIINLDPGFRSEIVEKTPWRPVAPSSTETSELRQPAATNTGPFQHFYSRHVTPALRR